MSGNPVFTIHAPTQFYGSNKLLQWGHVFSDVETPILMDNVKSREMLQWGHVFSDVETASAVAAITASSSASMGPRLFRRGNSLSMNISKRRHFRFNGATSFQTWKLDIEGIGRSGHRKLQWGHVFSDVETYSTLIIALASPLASMGPRLFRRGNYHSGRTVRQRLMSFNGATSFQTWKRRRIRAEVGKG